MISLASPLYMVLSLYKYDYLQNFTCKTQVPMDGRNSKVREQDKLKLDLDDLNNIQIH